MDVQTITETNAITGETVVRPMTDEELTEWREYVIEMKNNHNWPPVA